MIVRTWGAIASAENDDAYLSEVKAQIVGHLAQSPGYVGCYFLKKHRDNGWRYWVLTFWDSPESAQGLGENPHKAYVPEHIQAMLEQFDQTVEFYDVAVEHGFKNR